MNKILFLTTEIPFPLDNGGKIRTYNLIKALSVENKIDLICFSEEKNNDESIKSLNEFCENIDIVNKIFTNSTSKRILIANVFKSVISNKPFIVRKFIDKRYKSLIGKKLNENKYNTIVMDHLNICGYLDIIKEHNVILSQHNCEFLILKRRYEEETNFMKQMYLRFEYIKTKSYERKICSNVNKVIMLTKEDKQSIVDDKYKGNNIEILPIVIENNYIKKNINKKVSKLLFLGTMSWYPNEQGIVWFLENVWNELKVTNPDMKIYIVGKNPSNKIKEFKDEDIIVTGYVDDINVYIEKCDACIVPLFIGGGMRVKILECMSKGMPVISTTIGAEGIKVTNGEDILIADNKIEFMEQINALNDVELYNKIRDNEINSFNEEYSFYALIRKINSIFR